MERPTRLDSFLDWMKDHPVGAKVLLAGLGTIALANVLASVKTIREFILPAVAQAPVVAVDTNKDCKYLQIAPLVRGSWGGPPPPDYGFHFERITPDGPKLVVSSLEDEANRLLPQTLTLKHFEEGEYRIAIDYRPPTTTGGAYEFRIGAEQYYLLSLDKQSAAGFKVEAIRPAESQRFLEQYRPRILDCRYAGDGLNWITGKSSWF